MENKAKVTKKLWNGLNAFLRFLLKGTLYLLLFLLLLLVALQLPTVQTFLSTQLTALLSERTGFRTEIDRVKIRWWDAVTLERVRIYDPQDSLMVNMREIYLDFSPRVLFDAEQPGIDEIRFKSGQVRLLQHEGVEGINLANFIFRIQELFASEKERTEQKQQRFYIGRVHFEEGSVDILNYGAEPLARGFDYNRLRFRELLTEAEKISLEGSTLSFQLNYLRGQEATAGVPIQQLQTHFTYTPTAIELDALYLRSNRTEIRDYLRFEYAKLSALSSFTREVQLFAKLSEANLDIKDLRYFSEQLPAIEDRLVLSGEITGTIEDLRSEQLLIRFGERSALFGEFSIRGLPSLSTTYFELALRNSVMYSSDLRPYVQEGTYPEVAKLRDIRFDTFFSGYTRDFQANGSFRTGIGQASGSIRYTHSGAEPTYQGRVQVRDLDLGRLLENPLLQKTSFNGRIRGEGLSIEKALLSVDADIQRLGIKGYTYTNIRTNATYGLDLFSGELQVADPNLKAAFSGTLDLRNGRDSVNLYASIDTAFLDRLNLLEKESFLSGEVDVDVQGLSLDAIEGIARFKNIRLGYEGRELSVDNFFFQSLFTGEGRTISLNSDLLVAAINGNFKVESLVQDVVALGQNYWAQLTNDREKLRNLSQAREAETYAIDLSVNLIEINPLMQLFVPDLGLSPNTSILGRFRQEAGTRQFELKTDIDTLRYGTNQLLKNDLQFITTKRMADNRVEAHLLLRSAEQSLSNGLIFSDASFLADWQGDTIDLRYQQVQESTASYIDLSADLQLFPRYSSLRLAPSTFQVMERIWRFEEENEIIIQPEGIFFDNVRLQQEQQFIALNGALRSDSDEVLELQIENFNLDFFNTLSLKTFTGTANGIFSLNRSEGRNDINGNLRLNRITINDFLLGDVELATYFAENTLNVNLENYREGQEVLALSGTLAGEENFLNLRARLQGARLDILEPFLEDYVREVDGTVSGDLLVGGSLGQPLVRGDARLEEGSFLLDYTQTRYALNGTIRFTDSSINLSGLTLRDTFGRNARIQGAIRHRFFSDLLLDLNADLRNVQLLNTDVRDNELFYGTAFATGNIRIDGPLSDIVFEARLRSEPNTAIYIPLGSSNVQAQEDFIRIFEVGDTLARESAADQRRERKNYRLNFSLDITPDAYAEIQVDPRTGEHIQGRGRGVLDLGIDNLGNFTMNGTYEITEAKYNFSLYNVIRREFSVEPGGRISWFGDPYEGVMDLRAFYQESVSLLSLQANAQGLESEDAQLRRRWPLRVLMRLNGNILSPDIDFDFDFSEFPEGNIQTYISAFKNRIQNDEQEKNRQVFSVIMMRSFSPEGQFSGVTNLASSNLSQLLSSQLNSFIAQVDQNLEVDIDLATIDQTALETFQLRVAYTFLDGRLRVTRDGGFTDLQGNADINSIAGDWQAEYLLTQDGRYRMRIYNRNNFNTFTSLSLAQNVATYGVSLSQTLAFNSFRELFNRIRNRITEDGPTAPERPNPFDADLLFRSEEEGWIPIDLQQLPRPKD
ncbi:hypothetical protein A3SI_19511 [Nitritalea halalkaliphila LW7]|uniref:Translocation and assembly module TamB C-terminal domain-containing protein n=1 Tax=Nitritalea halalkaliphila LW7 TaxID=1189621 RepID=I5BSP5_9BACT|nr:translocation/assembly module TamB domain-containing protein [Nitritalea halalkaliphila]EIM72597.1 hypothetical protein A3SI_19511 [Nitritalea halalkaliphila LW7]